MRDFPDICALARGCGHIYWVNPKWPWSNQCFSHLLSCQWLFYTSNVLVLPGDCLTITGSFFGAKYGRLKQKLPICILLPIICMRFSGLALAWLHKATSTLKHNLICLAS